jgi:hypothetical protein
MMRLTYAPVSGALSANVRCNVFRLREAPELLCLLPEDYPVPRFLDGRWEFVAAVPGCDRAIGFDPNAAGVGLRLNGFHLFQQTGPRRRPRLVAQSPLALAA